MKKVFLHPALIVAIGIALVAALVYAESPRTNAIDIPPDRGAAGMSRWLRSLQTRASLLMTVAHPDDEDGGMLTYETRGLGARAALLTLNRGEGGQNVMANDMYDALGLTRTMELLTADRYLGVDQYFTSVVDYGFSKTREEAIAEWGHDRVLADAVRVVRTVRPLVMTSVFVGAATDGHGHHQMAGEISQEAWKAAGDPNMFPEQIREGLRPWSPLKVYARVPFFNVTKNGMYDYATDKYVPVKFYDYVTKQTSARQPSTTLEIPESRPDTAAGLTYLQIAREGLGFQKTQNGGGLVPEPAPQNTAYHRYGSRVDAAEHETSFFDGIDISVMGIATLIPNTAPPSETGFLKMGLSAMARDAADALARYSPDRSAEIAPLLADGLKSTRSLIEQVKASRLPDPGKSDVLFELGVKEQQYQRALATAFEISLQTTVANPRPQRAGRGGRGAQAAGNAAPPPPGPGRGGAAPTFTIAIPGQSFQVEGTIFNENEQPLTVDKVELVASDGKNWDIHPVAGPETSKESAPENQVAPQKEAHWRFGVTVPEDAALTRPYFSRPNEEQPYYNINDERYRTRPLPPYPLAMRATLSYNGVPFDVDEVAQTNERVSGIGLISNPLIVAPAISISVSPSAGAVPLGSKSFEFTATVHSNVKGPAEGVVRLKLPQGWHSTPAQSPFAFARDGQDKTITFSVFPDMIRPADYTITAGAEYNGKTYEEGYHLVGYPGLRPYPLYRPATYKAVGVDVRTAPGLHIGFLPGTGDDVPKALENLDQNVRVLSDADITHGDLSGYDAIILGVRAYAVRSDLKVANARLLDYVKNGGVLIVQYNLQGFDGSDGPYPFDPGASEKVVDEKSAVKFLNPSSPLFNWPNKITPADFNNWVEERGHGFLKTWDPRYQPLVETHDPGQDPQESGLLLARYGKGFYVYDAFALYRQLPSGVPGAYRLLANLVSLDKNPEWN